MNPCSSATLRGSIRVHLGREIPYVPINNTHNNGPRLQTQITRAALAVALLLAVTASTDEKAEQAQTLASHIAYKLNDEVQFEAVKDAVEACINYFQGCLYDHPH